MGRGIITKEQMNKKHHLKAVREMTQLLEEKFSIWKFKFGLDPILGLVPGAGDAISAVLSFYIVFVAMLHEVPSSKIIKMIWNILFDFLVGSIPFAGDLLDFAIHPNTKNLAILEKEIKSKS